MERVNKGEKYWYIYLNSRNIVTTGKVDYYNSIDNDNFRNGNYFRTKEEAEMMAEKIRKVLKGAWVLTPPNGEILSRKVEAVLNGADVIEMPSEEDIYD